MDFSGLSLVDMVAGIWLLAGMVLGIKRGLSGELARLAGLAVALAAGWLLHGQAGVWLAETTRLQNGSARLAGFIFTVVLAWLSMLLVRIVLKQLMEFAFKSPLEQIGGAVAGGLRTAFFVLVVIGLASLLPSPYVDRALREDSVCGRLLLQHLLPAYAGFAEDYPHWGLPYFPAQDRGHGALPTGQDDGVPPDTETSGTN